MQDSELDNIDLNEELEFNNGVGDALKQREEYVFSWKKTVLVLAAGLAAVILVTFVILEIGKSILKLNDNTDDYAKEEQIILSEPIKKQSSTNWDVLPEDIEEDDFDQNPLPLEPVQIEPPVASPVKPKKIDVAEDITPKKISVKVIKPIEKPVVKRQPSSTPVTNTIYRVIAGSYSNYNNAQKALESLKKMGYNGYVWSFENSQKVTSFKVQLGAFKSLSSAEKLVIKLKKNNIDAYISKH